MTTIILAGLAVLLVAGIALGLLWSELAVTEDEYSKVRCAHEGLDASYREDESVANRCTTLAQTLGLLRGALVVAGLVAGIGAASIIRGVK